jgi:lipoprotein-anchoring transpeptidase ErfK/SrfK
MATNIDQTTLVTPPTGKQPRQRRGPSGAFWVLLIGWLLFLSLVAGLTAGFVTIHGSDRILAGVQALGRDLGGWTPQQAAERLQSEWQSRRIVLETTMPDGTPKRWTLSPGQIGVMLDADATAALAYEQGREQPDPEGLPALLNRLAASAGIGAVQAEPVGVDPVWQFDRNKATETARLIANEVAVPVQDAGVQVVDGQVTTRPAVEGQSLDIASLLATLEAQPWDATLSQPAGASLHFPLPIVRQQAALTDVSGVVAEVSPLLSRPITLKLYDAVRNERTEWAAQPADEGRWLAFQAAAGGEGADAPKALTWTVDEEAIKAWLAEQSKTFGDERYADPAQIAPALADAFKSSKSEVAGLVSHGDREHIVKAGETLSSIAFDYGIPYPYIEKANPSTAQGLFEGDKIIIPSIDVLLPLPVVQNKRIVISMAGQTVKVYENGELKWDWKGSTGIDSSPTSPGVFQVQTHEEMAYAANWDLYMPWFMGIYRPVPGQDFMNGFHGFPSRDRRQLLWTKNLGHRVTYGCILLDTNNAKALYDWAEPGVVVEITR